MQQTPNPNVQAATVLSFGDDHNEAAYPAATAVATPVTAAALQGLDYNAAAALEQPPPEENVSDAVTKGKAADAAPGYPQQQQHVEGEHAAVAQPQRDFSSGICDCIQSGVICCDAYCCSYCLASAHHNFLMNGTEGVYAPVCCGLLCIDLGLSALSPYIPSSVYFHTCAMRGALRRRYNIHNPTYHTADSASESCGSGCDKESLLDCLAVAFCLSCVIAQHQREILHHGEWCGGVFSTRDSLQVPSQVHTV